MTPEYFWVVTTALFVVAIGYAIRRYAAHPVLGSAYKTIHAEEGKSVARLTGMPQTPAEIGTSHKEAESDNAAPPQSGADSECNQTDLKRTDDSLADAVAPIDILKSHVAGLSPPAEDGNNPPTAASIAEAAINVLTVTPSNLEKETTPPPGQPPALITRTVNPSGAVDDDSDAKAAIAMRSPSKSPAKKARSQGKSAKRLPKSKSAERLPKSESARV